MFKLETYFLCAFIALHLQGCLGGPQYSKASESIKSHEQPNQTKKDSSLPDGSSFNILKINETQVKLDRIENQQAVLKEAVEKVRDQQTALLKKLEDQQKTALQNLPNNTVPAKFDKIGDRFFYIEKDTRVNWFAAANTCRQMGGQLATIQSEEERVAVVAMLPGPFFWLGINNLANEEQYVSTATGQVAPFFQWGSGQPNKKVDNVTESCIAIVYELMHDYRCDKDMRFICEARA